MAQTDVEAAAEVAASMFTIGPNEAEQEAPSDTEDATAAPEEEVQEAEFPDLDAEVPEDILEELDVPDEEEIEIEEVEEEYEYEDPDILKKKLAAERKKNQFLEEQKVRQGVKAWRAEAIKYFPLSEYALDDIKATSRRAYLREARAREAAIKPTVTKLLNVAKATIEDEKEKARVEAKKEVQDAWGKPTTGPGVPPPEGDMAVEEVLAANERGGLAAVFKEQIRRGQI